MTHQQVQFEKPAQASSKAMFENQKDRKGASANREAIQQQALNNAVSGESVANYQAIFEGFAAKGIAPADVIPRENIFTFNAWKALGRVVRRGESGVKIVTFIPCTKKDPETGEEIPVKKVKTTTVFHISQTETLN